MALLVLMVMPRSQWFWPARRVGWEGSGWRDSTVGEHPHESDC